MSVLWDVGTTTHVGRLIWSLRIWRYVVLIVALDESER